MNRQLRPALTGAAAAFGLALLVVSCKEKGTIDLTENSRSADTTFTAGVEAPQLRNVLMEEYTGVTCPPCPAGHDALAALIKKYELNATTHESRLKAIGLQVYNFPQAKPIEHVTQHDNRTQKGTDLANGIYGPLSQTPVSGIDRISKNGLMYLDRSFWITEVGNRMILPTNVNLTVTSSYNAATKMATIKVHAAYTQPVAKKQVLTVALIENEVIDGQEDGRDLDHPVDTFYHHQHVLRDLLTAPTGNAILNDLSTKEAGRVYERTFLYDMSQQSLWVPQNCRIVAVISNAETGDKEVQQVADTQLVP